MGPLAFSGKRGQKGKCGGSFRDIVYMVDERVNELWIGDKGIVMSVCG